MSALARLLEQATPGPWVWEPMMAPNTRVTALRSTTAFYAEYRGVPRGVLKRLDYADEADARLIALAPDLARLLLDVFVDDGKHLKEHVRSALLARLAELEQRAAQ